VPALAAYNAGEGTVRRYGGLPPYHETIAYIERILTLYGSR
jgi:soluble lytic murein transglycosylase-like protein